jgi:hypothetical protein
MRPPGQTSRKGAGLGANERRAGPGGWRRAPRARAHHPPSGGPMSGAVVGSSARGTWRTSGAYPQCPNHPGRWGEPADTTRKAPRGPSQQHRTQILAVETSCRSVLQLRKPTESRQMRLQDRSVLQLRKPTESRQMRLQDRSALQLRKPTGSRQVHLQDRSALQLRKPTEGRQMRLQDRSVLQLRKPTGEPTGASSGPQCLAVFANREPTAASSGPQCLAVAQADREPTDASSGPQCLAVAQADREPTGAFLVDIFAGSTAEVDSNGHTRYLGHRKMPR